MDLSSSSLSSNVILNSVTAIFENETEIERYSEISTSHSVYLLSQSQDEFQVNAVSGLETSFVQLTLQSEPERAHRKTCLSSRRCY